MKLPLLKLERLPLFARAAVICRFTRRVDRMKVHKSVAALSCVRNCGVLRFPCCDTLHVLIVVATFHATDVESWTRVAGAMPGAEGTKLWGCRLVYQMQSPGYAYTIGLMFLCERFRTVGQFAQRKAPRSALHIRTRRSFRDKMSFYLFQYKISRPTRL